MKKEGSEPPWDWGGRERKGTSTVGRGSVIRTMRVGYSLSLSLSLLSLSSVVFRLFVPTSFIVFCMWIVVVPGVWIPAITETGGVLAVVNERRLQEDGVGRAATFEVGQRVMREGREEYGLESWFATSRCRREIRMPSTTRRRMVGIETAIES